MCLSSAMVLIANTKTVVETLAVAQPEFSVSYNLINSYTSRFVMQFVLTTRSNAPWNLNDMVQIVCIFVWEANSRVQIDTFQFSSLTVDVSYNNKHKYNSLVSYSLDVFACTFPLTFGITSKQTSKFSLLVTNIPNPTLPIYISYVLVQKIFISQNIFVVFNQFIQSIRDFIIMVDDYGYLRPSDDNTFLGIQQLSYTGGSIALTKMIVYSYKDPAMYNKLSMKVGYLASSSLISKLQSSYLNFNPDYSACSSIVGSASYLAYAVPFLTVPQGCGICKQTCLTCTSSQDDSTYTDSRFCTSCPAYRYLSYLNNGSFGFGSCVCLQGLQLDANGNCLLCTYNCLSFNVYLIRSSSIAVFLLTFTYGNLNYLINFEDNLQIIIDSKNIKYNSSMISPGVFKITVQSSDLVSCQKTCSAQFTFSSPSSIRTVAESKPLTTQQQIVTISDFYVIQARLPSQLTKAFLVTSMIISASSATGQAGFIKMLFQLQQVIQMHKYLNLELPVVFKQFVQALSSFRFMDFTTILQIDINQKMRQLSGSQLDSKGEFKIVYYQNGANFYKNMATVIFSTLIILCTNLLIYLFFKILPFDFTTSLCHKIKLRWPISMSDMIQTLVIPISLFATFQMSYTVLGYQYIWVYALAYLFSAFVLFFPFYCISMIVTIRSRASDDKDMRKYKKQQIKMKKNNKINIKPKINDNKFDIRSKLDQIDLQIIQDLLQDSKLSKAAYVFYVFGFLKKFMFGILLGTNLPGLLQLMLLLTLNIIHMLIIVYIIVQNLYMSKVKTLTRIINLICLIALESLILSYHLAYHSIEDRILIGVTCTYLALVTTGIGIIQLLIKLTQILYQKLKTNNQQGMTSSQKYKVRDHFIVNANGQVVQCKIQRPSKTVCILVNESDQQYHQDNNNEKEYQDEDQNDVMQNRVKRKKEFQKLKQLRKKQRERRQRQAQILINRNNIFDPDGSEWSKFSQNNENPNKNTIQYEDRSDSSDIVAIDSKQMIAWVPPVNTNKDTGLYRRPNSKQRRLRALASKQLDDRKPTASTQGEIHTITSSAKLKGNLRTINTFDTSIEHTIDRRNSKTKGDRQMERQGKVKNQGIVVENTKRKLINFEDESSMSDIVHIQQSK